MSGTSQGTGIRRRILKGIGGQAIGQVVGLVVQIAGVPLYLAFWGVELYGEWLILAAFLTWLAVSDLGFTTATGHAMTMEIAAGDQAAALTVFRTSWCLVTGLSMLVGVLAVMAALWLPLGSWFNFTFLDSDDVAWVLVLLVLYGLLAQQTGLLNVGFQCEGEYGEGIALLSCARLGEFVLAAVAVVAGYGPVGVAAALVVGHVIAAIAMRWRLRGVAGWLTFGLTGYCGATARRLFGPALGFVGFIVGNALNIQGPIFVIGLALGPAAVVPFATMRSLVRLVQQILSGASAVVRPEIGIAAGRGDMALMRRLNREACRLALWLVIVSALVLVPFGNSVIELWTVGRVSVTQPLFGVLIGMTVATAIWQSAGWTLQAVNRVQGQAIVFVVTNFVAFGAMLPLTETIGSVLPALALLAADTIMAIYVVKRGLAFLDERPVAFAISLLVPPVDLVRRLFAKRSL